jgi:hypothetical protein
MLHGRIFVDVRPEISEAIKLITPNTRNTPRNIFAISIETPAMPVAPSKIAIRAIEKKTIAARNIRNLL